MNHPADTRGWVQAAVIKFKSARTPLYSGFLALSVAGLVWSAAAYWRVQEQNSRLAAILAGEDAAIDPTRDADSLILARVRFLDGIERYDDAQAVIDGSFAKLQPNAKAALLYNHANALVGRAIGAVERNDLDGAIPFVNLAKENYRKALRLQPGNFDIKYNYDVAMRLVRDFPPGGSDGEDEVATPKKLWTDLPGVPKGLP